MIRAYMIQPVSAMRRHLQIVPETSGVYAFLLDEPHTLQPALDRAHLSMDSLRLGQRDILYLGATEDSLRRRLKAHLSDDTCRSTFRMSLGALLAEELDLKVLPRRGVRYFGFEPESEARLSHWIERHLSVAVRASAQAMQEERSLIAKRDPVLNISGRHHQHGACGGLVMRRTLRGLPFDVRGLH